MAVRDHNLEAIGAVYATFKVKQTASADDLTDANIGQAVTLTASHEVGPGGDGDKPIGKLIDLTLMDGDNGERLATVQIAGVCRMNIATTYPSVGDKVVGGASGTVKQAPALAGNDPAGGNIAVGTVLAVNGTTDCTVLLP